MLARAFVTAILAFSVTVGLPSPVAAQTARDPSWWTDASRILAGEEPNAGGELGRLAKQPSVLQHRAAFVGAWSQFEASRLKPAMKFAYAEIVPQAASKGPDGTLITRVAMEGD